jgi:hypothetical protein
LKSSSAADIFRMAGHMLGQRLLLFLLHHGLGVSFGFRIEI